MYSECTDGLEDVLDDVCVSLGLSNFPEGASWIVMVTSVGETSCVFVEVKVACMTVSWMEVEEEEGMMAVTWDLDDEIILVVVKVVDEEEKWEVGLFDVDEGEKGIGPLGKGKEKKRHDAEGIDKILFLKKYRKGRVSA